MDVALTLGETSSATGANGKLMAPIHVSIDPAVIESLLVVTIGIVATTVAMIAAIAVARQARTSPTAVEKELLPVQADTPLMTVGGGGRMSDPLDLHFILADPGITLLQIELANPLDKGAGIAQCQKAASEVFLAEVEPKLFGRWYNANGYWKGETKKLPISVFFIAGGHAECRTIWVAVTPVKLEISRFSNDLDFAWVVEGPCSKPFSRPASMLGWTGTERP